jgi:hypothetical protein
MPSIRVSIPALCVLVSSACGASARARSETPTPKTGSGQYEIVNQTRCEAVVFSADKTGLNRKTLGTVPSGASLRLYWAPLSEGEYLSATALTPPDGSGCGTFEEVASHLRVRALD